MNYGFVIDNRKCIGCHACSTACKSENDVPLGVNRTWVKSVEVGLFPDVRRNFQVTRCNHCANPPCVRICPTGAMYQRDDGIVEFNSDTCIGCKACMQACPYDAIHIDPETKTAAKCHFCSHRIEIGLEPACVVVCPEHAIISGDMDDPASEISRIIAGHQTTVRKPEQGTAPKVLYINGNDVSLHPGAAPVPKTMAAADVITKQHGGTTPKHHSQGVPQDPIQVGGGRVAGQMAQLHYNAQHEVPWHWPVPAYLVTKGIGAGAFGFLSLGLLTGAITHDPVTTLLGGALGIFATLVTTALLIYDLEHPERFLLILTRPQWRSWLTRGAFLLIAFSAVSGLWWGLELADWMGLFGLPDLARTGLALLTLPLAVGAAVYTAFLFGQAEGRDLWQSPLLPIHLLIQALMMGAAAFLLLSPFASFGADLITFARWTFGVALVTDAAATLMGELGIAHASEQAARAAREISHGRYSRQFWIGAMGLGHVVPLALLAANLPVLSALAAVCAGIGLYLYEHALVMAPQELPNS